MATNQYHETCVIKMIHGYFLLPTIYYLMQFFTFIKYLIREHTVICFWWLSLLCINMLTNLVDAILWYHIFRVKKMKTIICHFLVMMVEVAINYDIYISTSVVE
jgi:hypothetical protein